MKKVILYCRVSTEDQGDNNSPAYQESRLREYCRIMNYEVVKVILDKRSGKNFNRPGWKEIRSICKVKSNNIEKVLFLRWDRFARNIGLAINEIEYFKKNKVELNSCEQLLDQSNPNSIVLLSMYLSLPEAERNNISLRTSECTYEAQLNGKCTHRAPKGYLNYHISEKEKSVKVDPVLGEIVKWAFEEASKGIKSLEVIRKEVNLKGLKIGKSGFPEMLKNRFFIGYIYVKAWKSKPSKWVKGLHVPLIDEEVFYKVQEYHFGIKRSKPKLSKTSTDEFYLRQFLKCPHCGKGLTGCYSKGNGGEYPYYKCPNCNKFNANANKSNDLFVKYVQTLKPNPEVVKLYSRVFNEICDDVSRDVKRSISDAIQNKEIEQKRLEKADVDYIDGKIESDSYQRIIKAIKARVSNFDDELYRLTNLTDKNIDIKFDYTLNLLSNIGKVLTSATLEDKINVVGSMFPSKIEFDGKKYRTNTYNKVLDIIFQETSQLRGKSKEEPDDKSDSSHFVPGAGIEPAWK